MCSGGGQGETSIDIRRKEELTMTKPDKILFTAKVHTTGGREGASRSSDGRLDIKLSPPGSATSGTNPEQLFAAG
jgi:lipoyl-dependent peroxiredoxin